MAYTGSSVIGSLRCKMCVAAVLAAVVLGVSSASAGPGVIVAARVEAFEAPSETAGVVSELGRGAAVCVLDETNYAGVVHRSPGWLAIRLPGSGGIGYVRVEAIDLAAASPTADPSCGESASVTSTPHMAPVTTPLFPQPGTAQRRESGPVEAQMPLVAGGFLPLQKTRFVLGLGTGVAWLSDQAVAQHQLSNSGAIINASVGFIFYDIFSMSASAGAAFPSDNAPFSEQVVPAQGGGDPTTAGSSVSVARYSVAVGLRTPFWALAPTEKGWFAGALFADLGSAGIQGNRSISDCNDCRSDSLDFPGGTFWRVGLDLAVPSHSPMASYGFTIAYQRYLAGAGLTQELQVGLSLWLFWSPTPELLA